MNSVLAVYDIPQALKVKNPSALLRRFGFRVNLSCWVFPSNAVPTAALDDLRSAGATVHVVEFAEQAQEKILALAKQEIERHAHKMVEFVEKKCQHLRDALSPTEYGFELVPADQLYKKWRSVLSRARRELLSAQQCALGFGLTREIEEALAGLQNVLKAELDMALAYKSENKTVAV